MGAFLPHRTLLNLLNPAFPWVLFLIAATSCRYFASLSPLPLFLRHTYEEQNTQTWLSVVPGDRNIRFGAFLRYKMYSPIPFVLIMTTEENKGNKGKLSLYSTCCFHGYIWISCCFLPAFYWMKRDTSNSQVSLLPLPLHPSLSTKHTLSLSSFLPLWPSLLTAPWRLYLADCRCLHMDLYMFLKLIIMLVNIPGSCCLTKGDPGK